MLIKGLTDEDFLQYRKPSMVILFPNCSFKCEKECGEQVCQNSMLASSTSFHISTDKIIERYMNNFITSAFVFGGLEPFDSWDDLITLLKAIRAITNDEVVIYTGYTEEELKSQITALQKYSNVIIKFGRFIPHQESHYDETLGVKLASSNQYGKRIS